MFMAPPKENPANDWITSHNAGDPKESFSGQIHRLASLDDAAVLQWPIAPEKVSLEPGEIHLWAAAMSEFADQAQNLSALLSLAELARAQKFRFIEDRDRYVIRHGLARQILSRYLEQVPSVIKFRTGVHGKPELSKSTADHPLFFNTSHSADITIVAITPDGPIGVDIERVQGIPDMENIARRFFLPSETGTLMALPKNSRVQAFYNCWTRKEAFLKATGEGIGENLEKLEVTLAPGDEPEVLSFRGDFQESMQWHLNPFSPAPGYVGCVVYKSTALALSHWSVRKIVL